MHTKKKRKSLRKETFKGTFEGKESRIHFTLGKQDQIEVQLETFKPNPNIIKFGAIKMGNKTLKAYAFKNQPKLVFIRINTEFIPLNKFKLREMVSLLMKEAWFIGLFGKRAKKYRGKLQAQSL